MIYTANFALLYEEDYDRL